MTKEAYSIPERRKYIRLDTVFPVEFQLLNSATKEVLSERLQGFTNDIGKGGICLEINNLKAELARLIKGQGVKLALNIELPLTRKRIPALAGIAWVKEIPVGPDRYLIGLSYEEIAREANRQLMRYAWTKRLFVPVTLTIIILLGVGFALGTYLNVKLIRGNKLLVEQLVKIVQESSVAKQKVKEIYREREDLQLKIQALQSRIQTVEEEKLKLGEATKTVRTGVDKKVAELNNMIEKLAREKSALQEQLIVLQRKEGNIAEELLRLDKRKATLEKANLDKMYQWLQVHQSPRTGLVMSFEGDGAIKDWAFIYDQALVLQAYTNFSDFERARKMLDFFWIKAQRKDGFFINAYYATDGSPAEYTVHSGPNIWLGIAILQYTHKTKDNRYLGLAEEIAKSIISLQDMDPDGGIRGGPDTQWYATEHNLDAYAFFNMLYKVTGKAQYASNRDKVLNWLLRHTYGQSDIPVKRGKGDSTIATDTYAWSIAAIGPEKLESLGMNPDRIMEFAEKQCSAEVIFQRPEGYAIKVKGFDFAPQKNLARGGVVSSEWTAQMALAFKIMTDYYYKKGMKAKAHAYEMKADEYLAGLGRMIISSPSPSGQGQSCLPYASQDYVDTGHGWMTPKGDYTGSVAGTVYTLFAYYNYNPLQLHE